MCFKTPSPPKPPPLAPAAPPPPKPEAPTPAPAPLQPQGSEPTLKTKKSKRETMGNMSQGAGALKIPLNTGSSGGMNL